MNFERDKVHGGGYSRCSATPHYWGGVTFSERRCTRAFVGTPLTRTVSQDRWAQRRCRATTRQWRMLFVDFWPGFDTDTDPWLSRSWFLQNLPGLRLASSSVDADVIMFSVFGRKHQHLITNQMDSGKSAKLVFYTGENVRPPVGKVPLCLSFDHLSSVPSTLHSRLPLWVLTREVQDVVRLHEARLCGEWNASVQARHGFCSWVASNDAVPMRLRFVKMLTESYREVACGGEVMNNVGGPVVDKLAFLRNYRFNVAFENASHPGYCTEKLLHAFAAGCVPIYWGDPHVASNSRIEADFNPKAIISAHDFNSFEEVIKHIIAVDSDPALLNSYLKEPIFSSTWYERLRCWPDFCKAFVGALTHGIQPPVVQTERIQCIQQRNTNPLKITSNE